MSSIRVRFAPSPTGHLHIGGLRSAFFNWLFAQHHHGSYLLRIEDTDKERSKQEYVDSIFDSFAWADIAPDEPVVIQSSRLAQHQRIVQQLIDNGNAYRCYCPVQADNEFNKYDGNCRSKTRSDSNQPSVIRFKLPADMAQVQFDDMIRGTITVGLDQLDDFIIVRSDGSPMYNLVVVLDDAFMGITHVIRGEEHISNTPKQILLYQACGYPLPYFAHLPLILGSSGQKLSKRDAAVSVIEYRKQGFLPEALLNYLARLGWSYGDQELFTRQELIRNFNLAHVHKKGAIFDIKKLEWVNSIYMRQSSDHDLLQRIITDVEPDLAKQVPLFTVDQLQQLVGLYKERAKTLGEVVQEIKLLATGPTVFNQDDVQKWLTPDNRYHLSALIALLTKSTDFGVQQLSSSLKDMASQLGVPLVQLAQPVRLALVGKTASPGIFELMAILGKAETVKRLKQVQELKF